MISSFGSHSASSQNSKILRADALRKRLGILEGSLDPFRKGELALYGFTSKFT